MTAVRRVDEVAVLRGGAAALRTALQRAGWRAEAAEAFVVVVPDGAAPLLFAFERADWLRRLRHLRALGEPTAADVARVLELDAGRAARVVAATTRPRAPAVAVRDGVPVAVWVAQREVPKARSRSRAPKPSRPARGPRPTRAPRPHRVGAEPPPAEPPGFAHAEPPPAAANGGPRPPRRPARPSEVVRTPHLDVPEEALAPGEAFEVRVYLDRARARRGEQGTRVRIAAEPGETRVTLEVVLLHTEHFRTSAAKVKELALELDAARSAELRFRLEVRRRLPSDAGPAEITALFVADGRPCGQVRRTLEIAAAEPARRAPGRRTRPAARVAVHSAQPADLTVVVSRNGQSFDCSVTTPHLPQYRRLQPTPWVLVDDAPEIIASKLTGFVESAGTRTPEERLIELLGAGKEFYDVAPDRFKEVLWALVDAGTPPETVYVCTAEATFPWELVAPWRRPAGGRRESFGALGARCAVGRWIGEDVVSPPQRVEVRDCYLIAPDYASPQLRLQHAAQEIAFVEDRFDGQRVPFTIADLERTFAAKGASLLHFVCHGARQVNNDVALYLENGSTLTASLLGGMQGVSDGVGAAAPFVFLNACEVGQPAPQLVRGAGFPKVFADFGASAIVAALWSVDDAAASRIALEVYEKATAAPERPIADVLREIRARAYDLATFDDTLAAYCFYGDPHTTLDLV